jgi:hypothetical protein
MSCFRSFCATLGSNWNQLFPRALCVGRQLARGAMSAGSAEFGVGQIGIRAFSEAAVTE